MQPATPETKPGMVGFAGLLSATVAMSVSPRAAAVTPLLTTPIDPPDAASDKATTQRTVSASGLIKKGISRMFPPAAPKSEDGEDDASTGSVCRTPLSGSPPRSRRQSQERARPRSGSPMTRNRSSSAHDEGKIMQAMDASSRRVGPMRTYASRFQKLHGELKHVVERHEQSQPAGLWARRLWQACSIGTVLQLTVGLLLCVEGNGRRFLVSLSNALTLLLSLLVLVILQQAQLLRSDTMVISRAKRFLKRLTRFAVEEEFSSVESADRTRGRSVWLQTTRSISTVPVFDNLGLAKSIPSQLLVHGDRIMTPPDLWLVRGYCEESSEGLDKDSVVQDTPAAVQLEQVLGENKRPENLFDRQARMVNASASWTLIAVLLLCGILSVWGAVVLAIRGDSGIRDAAMMGSATFLDLVLLSHVSVVLPLLPFTIYLLPALLKVVCNAYIAAFIETIHEPLNLRPPLESEARRSPPRPSAIWKPFYRMAAVFSYPLAVFRKRHRRRAENQSDHFPMLHQESIEGGAGVQGGTGLWRVKVEWPRFLKHLRARLLLPSADQRNAPASDILSPCADLVENFGSATVFSFPDVDGVLAEPLLSVKQIFLLGPAHPGRIGSFTGAHTSSSSEFTSPQAHQAQHHGSARRTSAHPMAEATGIHTAVQGYVVELQAPDTGGTAECCFEEASAVQQHLGQLKPLGLNCLVNTNTFSDTYSAFIERCLRDIVSQDPSNNVASSGGPSAGSPLADVDRLRRDTYGAFVSCDGADASHLVGSIIGFTENACQTYKRVLELQMLLGSSSKSKHPPPSAKPQSPMGAVPPPPFPVPPLSTDPAGETASAAGAAGGEGEGERMKLKSMGRGLKGGGWDNTGVPERHVMSVVVEDARRRLQLFTKGDAESVIAECAQVWDGQELRPMTPDDVAAIMQHHNECVQKHYKCVALSYVSLEESARSTIASSAQLGRTLFLDRRAGGEFRMAGAADWAEEGETEMSTAAGFTFRRPKTQPRETLKALGLLVKGQIFIGMLTLRYRPMKEICESIDILSDAGIRFVFFSDLPETSTIAFGHQLGLWSDWNCCISLRDLPHGGRSSRSVHDSPPGSGMSVLREREAYAGEASQTCPDSQQGPRLPHGIAAIRRHIEEADDVPLRVSMFCDATPSSITQMLGILQEHGELVISCGSGLNLHNMPTFAKADMSISVEPLAPSREPREQRSPCMSPEDGGEADLALELSSIPCALTLGRDWSMTALIDIISASRMLLDSMRQAYVFVVTAALLHMVVALIGNCLFLPRVLDYTQVLITFLVIVPIFLAAIVRSGCAIASNVKAWNPMKLKLPTKAAKHQVDKKRYALYLVARILPSSCLLVGTFAIALSASLRRTSPASNANANANATETGEEGEEIRLMDISPYWMSLSQLTQEQTLRLESAVFEARLVVHILLVAFISFLAVANLHRTASLMDLWKHCKVYWLAATVLACTLQTICTLIALALQGQGAQVPFPPSIVAVLCTWPLLVLCVDEAIRRHDRHRARKTQQRLTLEFETLLGQTSPK